MLHHANYRINVRTAWWGLGAIISATTSQLLKTGATPYIYWWSHWYTREDNPKSNIFNWFYEQPEDQNDSTILDEWDYSIFGVNTQLQLETVDRGRRRWREILGPQVDKVGCFSKAFNFVANIPEPGILGVHYRGLDKRSEIPIPPDSRIIEGIRKIQKERSLRTVLICTDDERFLQVCLRDLEGVIYFRHMRAIGSVGLHEQKGSAIQCSETMTEILALGMCTHLYIGRSCVSDAALFLSHPTTTWEYYA